MSTLIKNTIFQIKKRAGPLTFYGTAIELCKTENFWLVSWKPLHGPKKLLERFLLVTLISILKLLNFKHNNLKTKCFIAKVSNFEKTIPTPQNIMIDLKKNTASAKT